MKKLIFEILEKGEVLSSTYTKEMYFDRPDVLSKVAERAWQEACSKKPNAFLCDLFFNLKIEEE